MLHSFGVSRRRDVLPDSASEVWMTMLIRKSKLLRNPFKGKRRTGNPVKGRGAKFAIACLPSRRVTAEVGI